MTPGNWFLLCYEVNITLNVAGRRKDPEVDPSRGPGPAQGAGGEDLMVDTAPGQGAGGEDLIEDTAAGQGAGGEDLMVDTAGASLLGRGQLRGVAVAPGLPRKTMTSIPGDS